MRQPDSATALHQLVLYAVLICPLAVCWSNPITSAVNGGCAVTAWTNYQLVMDFCQSHGVPAFVPTLTTDLCMGPFYGMPAKYAKIWYPQVTVVEPA